MQCGPRTGSIPRSVLSRLLRMTSSGSIWLSHCGSIAGGRAAPFSHRTTRKAFSASILSSKSRTSDVDSGRTLFWGLSGRIDRSVDDIRRRAGVEDQFIAFSFEIFCETSISEMNLSRQALHMACPMMRRSWRCFNSFSSPTVDKARWRAQNFIA